MYGKFGENLINQSSMKIVCTKEDFNREILDPYYKSHQILNENLIIVEKFKEVVELDRPIQIASSILELAKHEMVRNISANMHSYNIFLVVPVLL